MSILKKTVEITIVSEADEWYLEMYMQDTLRDIENLSGDIAVDYEKSYPVSIKVKDISDTKEHVA